MEKQTQPMSQVPMDNGHAQQQYQQQPQQYHYGQPNSANQAYGAAQPMNVNGPQAHGAERDWKVGTFDAFPANTTCLKACFLPCLHYGHTEARLEALRQNRVSQAHDMEPNQSTWLYAGAWLCGFAACLSCFQREKVRTHLNIRGTMVEDFLLNCCCTYPYSMTQIHDELSMEEQALLANGNGAVKHNPFATPMDSRV